MTGGRGMGKSVFSVIKQFCHCESRKVCMDNRSTETQTRKAAPVCKHCTRVRTWVQSLIPWTRRTSVVAHTCSYDAGETDRQTEPWGSLANQPRTLWSWGLSERLSQNDNNNSLDNSWGTTSKVRLYPLPSIQPTPHNPLHFITLTVWNLSWGISLDDVV